MFLSLSAPKPRSRMMFSSWRLSDAISSAIFASGAPYSVSLFAPARAARQLEAGRRAGQVVLHVDAEVLLVHVPRPYPEQPDIGSPDGRRPQRARARPCRRRRRGGAPRLVRTASQPARRGAAARLRRAERVPYRLRHADRRRGGLERGRGAGRASDLARAASRPRRGRRALRRARRGGCRAHRRGRLTGAATLERGPVAAARRASRDAGALLSGGGSGSRPPSTRRRRCPRSSRSAGSTA